MIVLLVLESPHRFGQLKQSIPDITEKMLIQTLQKLENGWYVLKQQTKQWKIIQSLYSLTIQWKFILGIGEQMAEIGKTL